MSDTVAEITISNRQKVSTHLHCFDLWRDNRDLFDPFCGGLVLRQRIFYRCIFMWPMMQSKIINLQMKYTAQFEWCWLLLLTSSGSSSILAISRDFSYYFYDDHESCVAVNNVVVIVLDQIH